MRRLTPLLAPLLLSACVSLEYDLGSVPVPISAKPAGADAAQVQAFEIEAKNILWVDGLAGRSQPDVAALLTEQAAGWDRIADLRVTQGATFHDWLIAHLSLTLVRMKTVVIEGQLVRDSQARGSE